MNVTTHLSIVGILIGCALNAAGQVAPRILERHRSLTNNMPALLSQGKADELERTFKEVELLKPYHKDEENQATLDYILAAKLEALKSLWETADHNFDFEHENLNVRTKVAPPLTAKSKQILIAGMRPEAVQDPEARAEYEKRIKENKRNRERYSREWILRDLQRRSMESIDLDLRIYYAKPEDRKRALAVIESHLKSEELKRKMLEVIARRL